MTAAVAGKPPPGDELNSAIASGLTALLEETATTAAERTAERWREMPAGAPLVTPQLAQPGPNLADRSERLVRDWQRGLLELVREQGSKKRRMARVTAYTVNATGLVLMIAVFASTAFIPTGAEFGVAAGTSVAAQKLLEAIFGDEAMRQLARTARDDLLARINALLSHEARAIPRGTRERGAAAGPAGAAPDRIAERGAHGRHDEGARRGHLNGPAMSLTDRVRGRRRRGEPKVDADALLRRITALDRFARASSAHVPQNDLRPATDLVTRAGRRLALSRDHTVVALAGATGSGKSSLFNRLSEMDLSKVGVRRPTTGLAHACVWSPERRHRTARVAGDSAGSQVQPAAGGG